MTAKELAEKIYNDFCLGEFTVEKESRFKQEVESLLSSALEEAKHEGYIEEANGCHEHCKTAKAAAYEECARIAEEGPGPGSMVRCCGDVRYTDVVVTGFQKWTAEKIRSLKDKL